jgi:hypothetical protein
VEKKRGRRGAELKLNQNVQPDHMLNISESRQQNASRRVSLVIFTSPSAYFTSISMLANKGIHGGVEDDFGGPSVAEVAQNTKQRYYMLSDLYLLRCWG